MADCRFQDFRLQISMTADFRIADIEYMGK
jgi:hypothetical protein